MAARPIASPRRLAAISLALVLIPSLLLVGLGWRLFREEQTNVLQQLGERRRQTADLAVSKLDQLLITLERQLATPAELSSQIAGGDAAVIVIERGYTTAVAGSHVAFLPVPSAGREVPPEHFAAADDLRLKGDAQKARTLYRSMTASRDSTIRAGALLRLAWDRPPQDRLDFYAQMSAIDDATIEGVPAALFGGIELCRQLSQLGRTTELRQAAAAVRQDLLNGRWPISRTVHEVNLASAQAWLGDPSDPRAPSQLLASGIETWWRSSESASPSGRRLYGGTDGATVIWRSDGERRTLLVALASFVQREWFSTVGALAASQHARINIRDPGVRSGSPEEERRSAFDSNLPWTVIVIDADSAAGMDRMATSLWLSGLAALVLVLGAAGHLVTRAISRELEVARLQSDFVAAVSHEFRTPLTSLRQLTEILVDERVADDNRRRAYYSAMARQTDRLHRLVESLLDFGRLEAGRSPYSLEPLDACALVRTVVEEFEKEHTSRGIRVDLDINGDAWQVAGDRAALTNALWNLLDNAVKYSPEKRAVSVTVARENGRLLIRVRDEGVGIPPAEHRAIFEKFVRGSRAKADGFTGTGIGLSIVHQIVTTHGGAVQVNSAPGHGSTFTVSLPLRGAHHMPATGHQ